MQKKISLGASVFMVLLAVLLSVMITYLACTASYRSEQRDALAAGTEDGKGAASSQIDDKLAEIEALYDEYYVADLDETKLADGVMLGYVYGTGDKYGSYYSAEEYAKLMADMSGEMQGIGILVIENSDYRAIEVVNVYPDSPASAAGVMPGDLIAYVGVGEERQSVAELGYIQSINKLKGEAGTMATFTAFRGEDYSEEVEFEVERGYVTEITVTSRVYEPDPTVGIVKISSFDSKTPEQFITAVEGLIDGGATRLVMDIRGNPGGELNSICTILDYLLPEGPVIRSMDSEGNTEVLYTSDSSELNVPMAVIVNGNTASAGELFASALKDYDKATLVGTTTYGKGSMQTIRQLTDGSAVRLTYSYYCPPYSDNYDGIGVIPDVEAELNGEAASKNIYKLTDTEDDQLTAAVGALDADK